LDFRQARVREDMAGYVCVGMYYWRARESGRMGKE